MCIIFALNDKSRLVNKTLLWNSWNIPGNERVDSDEGVFIAVADGDEEGKEGGKRVTESVTQV